MNILYDINIKKFKFMDRNGYTPNYIIMGNNKYNEFFYFINKFGLDITIDGMKIIKNIDEEYKNTIMFGI